MEKGGLKRQDLPGHLGSLHWEARPSPGARAGSPSSPPTPPPPPSPELLFLPSSCSEATFTPRLNQQIPPAVPANVFGL